MEIWYLLIIEKFLFYSFCKLEMLSFLEPKIWLKDDIYRLLKWSCFELFGDGKYDLFLSQEVCGKMIFTGYGEVLVLNFSVMGNTVFFTAKKLMERWFLHGLFELSMIFQDLGNTVFLFIWSCTVFQWQLFNKICGMMILQLGWWIRSLPIQDFFFSDECGCCNVDYTAHPLNLVKYHFIGDLGKSNLAPLKLVSPWARLFLIF